jgi:hypothetical protein
MRPTDRDYCVSTIAILQEQLRIINRTADVMAMRLDELDETLLFTYGQKEDEELDELMSDSWNSGYEYRAHLAKKAAEYEPPNPTVCLCDECWGIDDDDDECDEFYTPAQAGCDCDDCRCRSADPLGVSEDSYYSDKIRHRDAAVDLSRMSVGNIMDILTKTRKTNAPSD